MRRIYLSPGGEAKVPAPGENSHYGMAKAFLGPSWRGDAEDAYAAMWNLGWVRITDYGDKVFGEQYKSGEPVPIAMLTRAQRAYLEDVVLSGKSLIWNDKLYSLTSEAKQGQAESLVRRLIS